MYRITKKSRNGDVDEGANSLMADTLIGGTTLVEKESRSIGDIAVGGIIEWDDTFAGIAEGFNLCDGSTITDPLSSYNGSAVPDLNTNYLSIGGFGWSGARPDTNDIAYDIGSGSMTLTGAAISAVAAVELPHGATITSVIVTSNVSTENYFLKSALLADNGTVQTHAQESLNTEDVVITDPIVDNSTRQYFLSTSTMDATDVIWGAKIEYTPRFKFIIRIK